MLDMLLHSRLAATCSADFKWGDTRRFKVLVLIRQSGESIGLHDVAQVLTLCVTCATQRVLSSDSALLT